MFFFEHLTSSCTPSVSTALTMVLKVLFLLSFSSRYGRLIVYLISCFGVGITGVVVAFAPNFSVFVIFRFLQGVFGKGAWMTCFVIGKTCPVTTTHLWEN